MRRWATLARRLAIGICLFAAVLYFRILPDDYSYHASSRAKDAKQIASSAEGTPIEVAVVWPRNGPKSFLRGVHLAQEEINAAGGVRQSSDGQEYTRKLNIRYFDEPSAASGASEEQSAREGRAIAQEIARDHGILAVVGHRTESIMTASVIYHESDVLFVTPTNMDRRVTLHRFENTFRSAPRYQQVASAMVDGVTTIVDRKKIRLAVLYPASLGKTADEVSLELTQRANAFIESHGNKVDFRVVFASQYERARADYSKVIAPFVEGESLYDMILIMDALPDARNLRQQLDDDFAHAKANPNFEKPTVDLSQLDLASDPAFYVDVSERSGAANEEAAGREDRPSVFEQAAKLVLRESRQKVLILASRDSYGKSLGAQIRTSVADTQDDPISPLSLEMYRAFGSLTESYLPVVAEVMRAKCDFLLIAAADHETVELIDQLRQAGMDRPIICPPDLEYELIIARESDSELERVRLIIDDRLEGRDHPKVDEMFDRLREEHNYLGTEAAITGYISEKKGRTFVASVFDSESLSPKIVQFVNDYKERYGVDKVDALAAQGYQAIDLLREAFERGGSTVPQTSAAAMKLFVEDDGIFGRNRFSESGDLLGLEIVFKQRAPDGHVNVIKLNRADSRQRGR